MTDLTTTSQDSSQGAPASRRHVDVSGLPVGSDTFALIAGTCSVVSGPAVMRDAVALKRAGAAMLRGGWRKPRTRPGSYQGAGMAGLEILAEARAMTGLPIVTELTDVRDVEHMVGRVDMIQIGARNMQHQPLLTEVGRTSIPVLLKRGFGSTIEEMLGAVEYILIEGNHRVILCERGIRTFETASRFTLDIAAIQILQRLTGLPVVVDPSHAAGRRDLVLGLAKAAVAGGADGLIVEVDECPETALSDGPQQLRTAEFPAFAREVHRVAAGEGCRILGAPVHG
jgi:3-deoxy-7-phosphoheptulonate synthase